MAKDMSYDEMLSITRSPEIMDIRNRGAGAVGYPQEQGYVRELAATAGPGGATTEYVGLDQPVSARQALTNVRQGQDLMAVDTGAPQLAGSRAGIREQLGLGRGSDLQKPKGTSSQSIRDMLLRAGGGTPAERKEYKAREAQEKAERRQFERVQGAKDAAFAARTEKQQNAEALIGAKGKADIATAQAKWDMGADERASNRKAAADKLKGEAGAARLKGDAERSSQIRTARLEVPEAAYKDAIEASMLVDEEGAYIHDDEQRRIMREEANQARFDAQERIFAEENADIADAEAQASVVPATDAEVDAIGAELSDDKLFDTDGDGYATDAERQQEIAKSEKVLAMFQKALASSGSDEKALMGKMSAANRLTLKRAQAIEAALAKKEDTAVAADADYVVNGIRS